MNASRPKPFLIAVVATLCWPIGSAVAFPEDPGLLGAVSGGGGRVVVCRNTDGTVRSTELLDLWEARVLYQTPAMPLSGSPQEATMAMLMRLKNSYPFYGSGDAGEGVKQGQEFILSRLKTVAWRFLNRDSTDRSVIRLRGTVLQPTPDSPEIAWPADPGCKVEQVVNYQPGRRIFIDQDLFEKLDLTNQTALIAHEALYSLLRDNAKEVNSLRTRRAVGFVAGGGSFAPVPRPKIPVKGTICDSETDPFGPLNRLWILPDREVGEMQLLRLYIDRVGGTELMGRIVSTQPIELPSAVAKSVLTGSCREMKKGFGVDFGLELGGQIEFDRELHLQVMCQDGQLKIRLTHSKPGSNETEHHPLRCRTSHAQSGP